MINEIAGLIISRLEDLNLFRAVERTITSQALQTPPSVAVFLAYDKQTATTPTDQRELGWDLVLMVPAIGKKQGLEAAGTYIDRVRSEFSGWRPFVSGGVLPSEVPEIRMEGIEKTILVYTVRVTMKVMPRIIDKE